MPEGVITEVVGGFATIDFVDSAQRGAALNRLLAIGGPGSIQTVTRDGPRRKYKVPEGNAREAGLLDSPGEVVRGDQGYADNLAAAQAQVQAEGIRPVMPTSRNTYSGTTSVDEARNTVHVPTTLSPGSGWGETHPPLHADVISKVTAPPGPVEEAVIPEFPEGEPSDDWTRPQLNAYARVVKGLDTADAQNKAAVLDAIRSA